MAVPACIEWATCGGRPGNRPIRRATVATCRLAIAPALDLTHSRFAFVA
ncbi:hypothetical protein [uncultured Reyranella sp.]|nr:hypothetical protein [uncultured Reyranella sp.]